MTTRYTNDPTRNVGARTTHDPTAEQGGGGPAFVLPRSPQYVLSQRGVPAPRAASQPLPALATWAAASLGEFPFNPWPQPDGT